MAKLIIKLKQLKGTWRSLQENIFWQSFKFYSSGFSSKSVDKSFRGAYAYDDRIPTMLSVTAKLCSFFVFRVFSFALSLKAILIESSGLRSLASQVMQQHAKAMDWFPNITEAVFGYAAHSKTLFEVWLEAVADQFVF